MSCSSNNTAKLVPKIINLGGTISNQGKISLYFINKSMNNEDYTKLLKEKRREMLDLMGERGEWTF